MPPEAEDIDTGDRVLNDQTEAIRSKYQLQHFRGKLSDKCPFCNKAMSSGTEAIHRAQCAEAIAVQRSHQMRRQAAQKDHRLTEHLAETRRKLALIGFVLCPMCNLAYPKSRVAVHLTECSSSRKPNA